MKRILCLLFLALPFVSIAQHISFDFDEHTGQVETIYILQKNTLFRVSKEGCLTDIILCESPSEARLFLHNPKLAFYTLNFIIQDDVKVFYQGVKSRDYYDKNFYDSDKVKYGKLSKLGEASLNYYSRSFYDSDKVKTGKLSTVCETEIVYFDKNFYRSDQVKKGKIARIGDVAIDYYCRDFYSGDKYNLGKISKVGDVPIEYYTKDFYESDLYKAGKAAKIGNVSVDWYTKHYYESDKIKAGRFMGLSGSDQRFVLF